MKKIFVAATGQHVGKTTSTLGLVANLIERGYKTGYCKPVGQKSVTLGGVKADKDAVLFSKVIGFQINPHIHSPVILGRGVTANYIANPNEFRFHEKINHAAKALESQYEVVVYEGTGHPGVGSVVDVSNADVAKMLNAGVIMIVEGGIGSTIDRLAMSSALFREREVPIIGVIVNKVKENKYKKVKYYLEKKFKMMDMRLLGVLPYDPTLSFPIMATIKQAVNGKVVLNAGCLGNKVEDIIPGSLIESHEFKSFENILLVVSNKRLDEALEKIQRISEAHQLEKTPLSGIIITTADGTHALNNDKTILDHPYFSEHEIPVLTSTLDTYGSVVKISRIEVKINTRTPWKSKRAIELIKQYVDLDQIMNYLELKNINTKV